MYFEVDAVQNKKNQKRNMTGFEPQCHIILDYMTDYPLSWLTFISLTHLIVKLDVVMSSKLCYE